MTDDRRIGNLVHTLSVIHLGANQTDNSPKFIFQWIAVTINCSPMKGKKYLIWSIQMLQLIYGRKKIC